MNHARGVNCHGDVLTVVERASAQVPRIQVPTEDHEFIRLFAATDFRDDVFGIHRAGDAVRHFEMNVNFFVFSCEKTRDAFGVFSTATTKACGIFSTSPFTASVWRYSSRLGRDDIQRTATASAFSARSRMAGPTVVFVHEIFPRD